MSSSLVPRPFRPNSRGNRLEGWRAVPGGAGHYLWLRCAQETLDQIKRAGDSCQDCVVPPGATTAWTHVLYAPGPLDPRVETLLQLLSRVLTLPTLENVTSAVALDWYKIPPDEQRPDWQNTPTGDLIHRGKYWYKSSPEEQAITGRTIAGLGCEAVWRHPQLEQTAVILDVPGHDSRRLSFGSRLAATVARDTAKRFIKVSARDVYRAEAKSLTFEQRRELIRGQFSVREYLGSVDVLIVDDVFRSGLSMSEVARAAREAGARSVYGLTAVRTMRK